MAKYAENGVVSAVITREIVAPEIQTWSVYLREFPSLARYGAEFYRRWSCC